MKSLRDLLNHRNAEPESRSQPRAVLRRRCHEPSHARTGGFDMLNHPDRTAGFDKLNHPNRTGGFDKLNHRDRTAGFDRLNHRGFDRLNHRDGSRLIARSSLLPPGSARQRVREAGISCSRAARPMSSSSWTTATSQ